MKNSIKLKQQISNQQIMKKPFYSLDELGQIYDVLKNDKLDKKKIKKTYFMVTIPEKSEITYDKFYRFNSEYSFSNKSLSKSIYRR